MNGEVHVDEVMARREVHCAARSRGEMNIPHLFEVAAEVAAFALEEEVDAIAREDLRDLSGAKVDNAPRTSPPRHPRERGQQQQQGGTK